MDFGFDGSSAFAAAESDHLQHALRVEELDLARPVPSGSGMNRSNVP
jgi:hypothetical protein